MRDGSVVWAEQWYMRWPTQPISPKTAGGFNSAMINFRVPEVR